jgi:MFS family permease
VIGGLLLSAMGLSVFALPDAVYLLIGGRALSGLGQGLLFIGIQSYILAVASPGKKTQGAGIIVFGFQGGMISGTAIGALLVTYMGATGVFTLGASICVGHGRLRDAAGALRRAK